MCSRAPTLRTAAPTWPTSARQIPSGGGWSSTRPRSSGPTAYAFTSKDGYLNKAHSQHLETRLIGLALAAKRCRLENVVQCHTVNLAEMDRL